jgi:hypothetical protein
VPGFFSSRPNWDSPPSHPQASVPPPPFGSGGCTLARGIGGDGGGSPNSDEGTDTVVL